MKYFLIVTCHILPIYTINADDRFNSPGLLEQSSVAGHTDSTIYYPKMRFPMEKGPAYANSQVYRPGGLYGGSGSQCDSNNYAYPWSDNFCESRRYNMPLCPSGKGHQGQDIRPAKCRSDFYWTVAVSDGVIAQVGRYSVTLLSPEGTLYRYLHLNMDDLAVQELEQVNKGERIGKVSNWFGQSKTTIHLHFDIKDTLRIKNKSKIVYIPPYTSLVNSYKKLMGYE
ncbi:MAG: M23 family metallopeptidase [Candidatus Thiodiazotropha endolucinida]